MKAFITGGSGFVGKNLKAKLQNMGWEIEAPTSKECDLQNPLQLQKFNSEYSHIFHLAAWTQAGDFCVKHPAEQWVINQRINTNMLAWWMDSHPQARLVFMGTSCVYDPELPLVESNFMAGEPVSSLFTYAHTKRMMLVGALAGQKQFNMNWNCFVPSTIYGPNYHTDGRQLHFIFDLCRKILRGKHLNETVTLWGDGTQIRELINIDDFTDIMLETMDESKNDILNIGSGQGNTIIEFAQTICDIVDYEFEKIEFDTSRYVGAKSKVLDISKLRTICDKEMKSLKAGLDELLTWFEKTESWRV